MGPEDTIKEADTKKLIKEARYQDRISKEMFRRSKSRAQEGGPYGFPGLGEGVGSDN